MADTLVGRALRVALMAFVTGIWCWMITAFHTGWSLGMVRGYFDGGQVPLYPSIPVTWATFFVHSIGAFAVPFVVALIALSIVPHRLVFITLLVAWLVGFALGANEVAYTFQIDYGTTWGSGEAVRALIVHPIVTPFALIFGALGLATVTRTLRRRPR